MSAPITLKYKGVQILINLDSTKKYQKDSSSVSISDCVVTGEIYTDVKSGKRVSDQVLISKFGTDNVNECLKIILREATLPVTTAEKKLLNEQMLRKICHHFNMHYVDPTSNKPHPQSRIEAAIQQAKYRIDYTIPLEKHVQALEKKFPGILSLRKLELTAQLKLDHKYLGKAYGVLNQHCSIGKTEYGDVGATLHITCSPGQREELYSALTKITGGDFSIHFDGDGVTVPDGQATSTASSSHSGKTRKNKKKKKRR